MKDNSILIRKAPSDQVKKALQQWIKLYFNDLPDNISFELSQLEDESVLIQTDERLENQYFYYLINYLNYPENINYNIDIKGYTRGKDKNILQNKDLVVFIPSTDNEYDNVYITTSENKSFKMDFGGKLAKLEIANIYANPDEVSIKTTEKIKVNNKEIKKEPKRVKQTNTASKLQKRFNIFAIIIPFVYLYIHLIFKDNDDEVFARANFIFGFIIWGWLVWDYKILQINRIFYGLYILATIIFIYGSSYDIILENSKVSQFKVGTFLPIFFLTLQRPTRLLFIYLLKREPIVDKPAPSFQDGFYIMFLFLVSLLAPVFLFTKF